KGQTYSETNGKVTINSDVYSLMTSNPSAAQTKYNLGQFILFGHDKYKALAASQIYQPALTTFFDWGKGKLVSEFPWENVQPKANTLDATNYLAITNDWTTTNIALVRSSSENDFNSTLSAYKSFQTSHNWSSIQTSLNSQVQSNLKKLGMKSNASTGSGN
ncbi:MAG: hypothetical protein LBI13_04180, partial [Streptococcaceae bacterium]|nr:hypothetical protein [Streptococcaceae bacterium]